MRGEGNWRGEHGKMEAGGGGEDLGKGRSLLVKAFCFSMSEIAARF